MQLHMSNIHPVSRSKNTFKLDHGV